MLTIPGTSALSRFRIEKLLTELQAIDGQISAITARYQHFVQLDGALSDEQQAMLQRLLDYGFADPIAELSGSTLWVVPRLGTISPWSSKASEIAERCGFFSVKRIERGIEYTIASNQALSTDSQQAVAALLHDRMTQQ
ncbi:MAG: hypothetical protein RLZ92_1119, partial [Pseudomonadota bacterium]